MSAIVIKEGLVHYEVIGRGRPLLFIHGWLGSWRYWVPTMEELSCEHRTYALDLWGFGDSDKLSAYYSLEAYVELLQEFLDQLGIRRVPIVGHALGGVVALLFAARFPERVEQVMGVSVPLVGTDINRPLAGFSGNGNALARLVARRANFPEVGMEARKTDVAAITHSMRSVMQQDLCRLLLPLKTPVLLVYGRDDSLVKPPLPEWLQDCDDNVRFFHLDGAQHFPMLEERNKFNRLLMDFLDSGGDLTSLELKEEWQRRLR
ncbi:MAG: alpha/beta fold hydrolase [Chloroflexi bacterium]|jgi:pimeloyl-ACP methyl ester carboxylesterase|nr:alpha/beta fold hydrolase [Chloroflexota bacterium]